MTPTQNKSTIANGLGVSRSTLYYKHTKPINDWYIKTLIEQVLRLYPSYGSRRIAIYLKLNRKCIKRIMNIYGIKPYRRSAKKWIKPKQSITTYPNLLHLNPPLYKHHIWASDFTYIKWQSKTIYLCTILDIYTRTIIGLNILTNHTKDLIIWSFLSAIYSHPIPEIFHTDNGVEYDSYEFKQMLNNLGISISRSKKGCPWENGYQESFYGKFKIDLGDPNRFNTLGELVFEIYKTIHIYNKTRIHSALKMSPYEYTKLLDDHRNSV